ncbi:transketolase family protein [Clostridium weizhouense]|uniref:Transketolase family protein n=1 Tax=Clostridium weizhouense TaxID=2859781 RepID=A0ABS7AUN9_9CLOT|nr:transketolase C-terminal domain-containing protein [Clostridium weizhouense]MBW6411390.1 transketolase family protein [Clostridium weizhouense]
MEMRKVLCNVMEELMNKNDNIVFMDADLAEANGTMPLRKLFPERAFDIGISEANMASMAAGMSAYGMNPYICTFTAFSSRRICDQIAISMAYAKQNVKIIATDAGIASELNGGTHMSFEDIGVLRSIPGVTIIDVVDEFQLKEVLYKTVDYKGVVYIRIPRKDVPKVYDEKYEFNLSKADVIKEGKDITIFATGLMTNTAVEAGKLLEKEGIDCEIISVSTIKPIDKETIMKSLNKTKKAITIENHNVIGGLYSAIAEVSCAECPSHIVSLGVKDHFGEVGSMKFLSKKYKMTAIDIVETCKSMIK